jgi:hypothetical protein
LAKFEDRPPPAGFNGTRRMPDRVARRPNPRHGLTSFGRKSQTKGENALLMPWVDVQDDMDAINRGEGMFDPATRQTWSHGRLYGMHDTGRTFPMRGEGIISCERETYRALTIIRKYNGLNERSAHEIEQHPMIEDDHRDEAIRIWRIREELMRDGENRSN